MTSEAVTARDRIAERVKNAYAAGYNDSRKGLDRMDGVVETETAKILGIVREAAIEELCAEYGDDGEGIKVRLNRALDAAFGADDDGGEQ